VATNNKSSLRDRFYKWTLELIKFIEGLPRDRVSDTISRQLIRSGTSILANYVEGGSASSRKDFTNFLNHSLKSANESLLWLSLLKDTDKGNLEKNLVLSKELGEIAKILASSIIKLRANNK